MSRPTPNENDRGAIVTPGDAAAVAAKDPVPEYMKPVMGKSYAEYRVKTIARFFPKGLVVEALRNHGEFQGEGAAEKFVMTELWKFDVALETPGCGFRTSSKPFSLRISKGELNEIFLDALLRVNRMVWEHALINMPEGDGR